MTLLVGIEMSFLWVSRFLILFRVSRPSLTSIYRMSRPQILKKHALVGLNNRMQTLDAKKEISIPKRRLRPPRYHKKDISIPKKAAPDLFVPRMAHLGPFFYPPNHPENVYVDPFFAFFPRK